MKKRYAIILFVLLVLSAGLLLTLLGREPVEEGRCTLRRKATGDPSESQLVGFAWQFLQPEPAEPNDTADSSQETNESYSYRMTAATENVPIVLDVSDKPTLRVDTNGDGLLSDERGLRGKTVKLGTRKDRRWRFGPIRITSGNGDDQATAAFYALCYTLDRAGPLSLYPAYYQRGKLCLGQDVYAVAVVDGDYDGQFGSVVSLPVDNKWRFPQADIFAIDHDRDGEFEISLYKRSEAAPLGKMVRVGDTYYAIDVAADGSRLALEVVEPQLGHLAIDPANAVMELRLWSDAADQYLPAAADGWELPVGKYQTLYAVLTLRDSERNEWTFSADINGDRGALTLFEVQPGQTTRIQVGPPFFVTADVRQIGSDRVSISPVIRGCAGEEYQANFMRNGRRAPAPGFRIVDEDGNVLVDNTFQFG